MSIIQSDGDNGKKRCDTIGNKKFKKSSCGVRKQGNICKRFPQKRSMLANNSTHDYPGLTFDHLIQIETYKASNKHLFVGYDLENHKCDIDCKLYLKDSNLFFCIKTWAIHKESDTVIKKRQKKKRDLPHISPILYSKLLIILRKHNILFNEAEVWRYTLYLIEFVQSNLRVDNLNEYSGHALCIFLIFTHDCFNVNDRPYDKLIILLKKMCNERNLCNVSSLILEGTKKKTIMKKTKQIMSELMNDPTWFMEYEPFDFVLSSLQIG